MFFQANDHNDIAIWFSKKKSPKASINVISLENNLRFFFVKKEAFLYRVTTDVECVYGDKANEGSSAWIRPKDEAKALELVN